MVGACFLFFFCFPPSMFFAVGPGSGHLRWSRQRPPEDEMFLEVTSQILGDEMDPKRV